MMTRSTIGSHPGAGLAKRFNQHILRSFVIASGIMLPVIQLLMTFV